MAHKSSANAKHPVSILKRSASLEPKDRVQTGRKVKWDSAIDDGQHYGGRGLTEFTQTPQRTSHSKNKSLRKRLNGRAKNRTQSQRKKKEQKWLKSSGNNVMSGNSVDDTARKKQNSMSGNNVDDTARKSKKQNINMSRGRKMQAMAGNNVDDTGRKRQSMARNNVDNTGRNKVNVMSGQGGYNADDTARKKQNSMSGNNVDDTARKSKKQNINMSRGRKISGNIDEKDNEEDKIRRLLQDRVLQLQRCDGLESFYSEFKRLQFDIKHLDQLDGKNVKQKQKRWSDEENKIIKANKDNVLCQIKLLQHDPKGIRSLVAIRKQRREMPH
eukprot:317870_1